jgi:hypothetical protein
LPVPAARHSSAQHTAATRRGSSSIPRANIRGQRAAVCGEKTHAAASKQQMYIPPIDAKGKITIP